MKKMKIVIICFVIFIIGGISAIPFVNNYSAYKVEKELRKSALPRKTELIESLSQAGKLTGNGNGMQYFGAILIRSELSLDELETFFSRYRSNEWEYLVEEQKGQSIGCIEHGNLQFEGKVGSNAYYIVYTWGDGKDLFSMLDLRGN